MKKTFKFIAIAFALVLCAASCTFTKKDTYLKAVPADAKVAAKVACKNIYDLAALSENAKFSAIKKNVVKEIIEDTDSRRLKDKVLMLAENADNSGIDFSKPVIAAHSLDLEEMPVIIAAVENVELLVELCKAMEDEDSGYDLIRKGDGIYLFDADEEFLCAFNDKALVVFPDSDFDDDTEYYLVNLLRNEEICKSNGFDKFIADPSEIAVWVDVETLFGAAMREMSSSERKMLRQYADDDSIAGAYLMLTSKFNSRSIDMELASFMNKDAMERVKKYTGEIDKEMLRYLPSNVSAFACINLGDLETIIGEAPRVLVDYLKDALDDIDLRISDVPTSLAVAVLEYDKRYLREETDYLGDRDIEYDTPDFVAVCKTSKKVYNALKDELEDDEEFKMFYNDGYLTIATPAAARNSDHGIFDVNFSKSELYKTVSGSPISLAVDAKKIALWDMIKSEEELDDMLDIRSFFNLVNHLNTVSFVMTGPASMKFSITVDDTSTESILQSIASIAVEYAYLNLD